MRIVGLDVGGAHLKVATVENGQLVAAAQIACPLWQGAHHLDAALAATAQVTGMAARIAITMTAELSDLYENRRAGVESLVDRLATEFSSRARFWQGTRGFGSAQDAKKHHANVGSANFLATARFAAEHIGDGLLIDMGSTTTDIIPINRGQAAPRGLTDAERLATGELVYTGLTRTAVMAVSHSVPFKGRWHGLAREYFATMADVRRILGELPGGVDHHDTADGRGKSDAESLSRFARMFGSDAAEASLAEWQAAAAFITRAQMRTISDGATVVRSGLPTPAKTRLSILTTGIGYNHVRDVAATHAERITSLDALFRDSSVSAAGINANAPAIAVAMLLNKG